MAILTPMIVIYTVNDRLVVRFPSPDFWDKVVEAAETGSVLTWLDDGRPVLVSGRHIVHAEHGRTPQ